MTTALTTPTSAVTPRSDLTPRERQVASLVTAGLSNDQIARRLGISRWTVVNHLRRVMRKWACTSRVDVAVLTTASQRSAR